MKRNKCLICSNEHLLKIGFDYIPFNVKGVTVVVPQGYYICHGSIVTTPELSDRARIAAVDAYKRQRNLLTSDEMVSIRGKYGISQESLQMILGWGGATIKRYERFGVQSKSYNRELLRIRDHPDYLLSLLEDSKQRFTERQYEKIKKNILLVIERTHC